MSTEGTPRSRTRTRRPPARQLTDKEQLKGLAHPLRVRLYDLLTTGGPATVSALAEQVDEAVGNVSYHLGRLAATGYLEEAPDLARDGRERWWRAVPGSTGWSWADFLDDPAGMAVARQAWREGFAGHVRWITAFHEDVASWGADWADAAFSSMSRARVTPDELREMQRELAEVELRWANRQVPDDGKPREHVHLFLDGVPVRTGRPDEEPA